MPPFIWNIPNAITLTRFIMVPLSCLPLLPIFGEHTGGTLLLVTISFIMAGLTDCLDGYLARKLNQMTDWGAYMDPLMDKFLVWGLFLVLTLIPQMNIPIWTFIVIFGRDLLVTEMRNFAIKKDISFKTSSLAKIKTSAQMIVGGFILIFLLTTYYLDGEQSIYYMEYWVEINPFLYYLPRNLVILVSIFTGITGIDYAIMLYKKLKN